MVCMKEFVLSDRHHNPNLAGQLTVITIAMLLLMALYEAAKQFYFPDISIWGSHMVTIVFTTLLAVSVSFFILKQFHGDYRNRVAEIARRRDTERSLKASESKYRLLFEQSRDAIIISTSDGDYLDINPAYEQLLGYSRAELMRMNALETWLDKEERRAWVQQMERDGYVSDFQCGLRRKDGRGIIALKTSSQRLDPDGRRIYQTICRDISERKRSEAEKEGLIVDLQKALVEVRKLSGMLPICASCKRIRNDEGYWQQIESYIAAHSEAVFSHGVCPDCAKELYPELESDTSADPS